MKTLKNGQKSQEIWNQPDINYFQRTNEYKRKIIVVS